VIALPNPDAEALIAQVDPRYWLMPWSRIQLGGFQRGEQFCAQGLLQDLCSER
jgi:hypothetical protein